MEALRQLWAFIVAIFEWLNDYKFYLLASAFATAAAVITARVMRWLDEGLVRGLGIWFSGLALLFVSTVVTVRFAVAAHASLEQNAPYAVALVVLLVAAGIWWTTRKYRRKKAAGTASPVPPPSPHPAHASSAILVLIASAALIVVLWIVDASIELNEGPGGALEKLAKLPVSSAEFLAQAAAAGLLAMATIQGVRTIVPIRGAFHRAALIRWIDESVKGTTTPKAVTPTPAEAASEAARSWRRLLRGRRRAHAAQGEAAPADDPTALLMEIAQMASPASGAHHYALFDLPIEQLCGQVAAAADRLLDNVVPVPAKDVSEERTMISIGDTVKKAQEAAEQPRAVEDPDEAKAQTARAEEAKAKRAPVVKAANDAKSLLQVLSASRKDIDEFLGLAGAPATKPARGRIVINNLDAPNSQEIKEGEIKEGRDRLRLRAAISQRIQQNIDRLQIDATFWWKRLLRGVAVTICGVLGFTLLDGRVSAVVFAIVGGFVATVARDIVAIIEKSRR